MARALLERLRRWGLWGCPRANGVSRSIRDWLADPGLVSLKGAARAAIVMPGVFAIAEQVIGGPQAAIFAAFGCFAMLVFVDFGGAWRGRLVAYVSLGAAGAVLVVLGTLCSRNAWIAAAAMAVIGFAILFFGVVSSYVAVAGTSAVLAFILPVTIPAPVSAIPYRLEGWGLAASASVCAVMLLWPKRPRAELCISAARACRALANLAQGALERDVGMSGHVRQARDAVAALRQRFLATTHRPTGPAGPTAAIAALVDELDWLLSFLARPVESASLDLCRREDGELLAAVVAVLRSCAARLEGGEEEPDLDRLEDARRAVADALAQGLGRQSPGRDDRQSISALEPSFRLRAISYAARQVAHYALLASGATAPDLADPDQARWHPVAPLRRSRIQAMWRLASGHVSWRSVWLRNSIRGAVAVTIAVFIAQQSELQNAFWVVLGTLSVLRSNALGTGATVLRGLVGNAVGIVAGGVLIVALGTREPMLWSVLPLAVLLAAYAPRAISFAAGQAGFTIALFVIFNLIQPVGWEVGVVRIEDVAIGFAVSLGVGVLFWPRGAAAVLRENLAGAYVRNADYVAAAANQLLRGGNPSWSHAAAQAAFTASDRLDDAYRQYIRERTAGEDIENVGTLVAGAARVRRAAQSLSALSRLTDESDRLGCASALNRELGAVHAWYAGLGRALAGTVAVPAPHTPDLEGRQRILHCVRDALDEGDKRQVRPALTLLWAGQHLDNLRQLEHHLGRHATKV